MYVQNTRTCEGLRGIDPLGKFGRLIVGVTVESKRVLFSLLFDVHKNRLS